MIRNKLLLTLVLVVIFSFNSLCQEEMNIVTILRRMFPEATIEFDRIRNTLIVTAPPDLQREIEKMIERLDIYTPQITIEAKFVELTVNDINELGIDLDIANIIIDKGDNVDIDFITDWADTDAGFPNEAAAASFWYTRLSNTAFQAIMQALEKQKKVNVLSAPRITTLNGQPATIHITETIPYVTEVEYTTSDSQVLVEYTVEERDAGIYLEVTPTVPEGSTLITLHIKPTVRTKVEQLAAFSDVPLELGWPVIDERTTETNMIISSGETVVLGGLIKDEAKVVEKKFPLLGDIPLLGNFFKYKYSMDEKKNLLIFLTAYLVSPDGRKILAGR